MKKIFYLAAILLAFISCTSDYTTTITNSSIEHVDLIYVEGYTGINGIKVFEIEHNGHDYLIFDGYEAMGVEHSPDCKKCKSKSEYTPTEYLY
jgi:hypothetical protein